MAKNSIFDPTKDGVKADNSGYSSNQIDTLINESAAAVIDDDAAGDDTVYSSAKIYSLLPEDTATGAEVTITDACPDLPIVAGTFNIDAYQDGSGTPAPDNVRAIHGYTGINIHVADDETPHIIDNIYPITLEDECYGGYIDYAGSKLVISHYFEELKTQYFNSTAANQYGFIRFVYVAPDKANGYDLLCDKLPVSNTIISSETQTEGISGYSANGNLYIGIDSTRLTGDLSTTAGRNTAFKDYLDSINGIHVVYELAEPIEIHLTLPIIKTIESTNNISCDTGDSSVTYKKLTTLS